MKRRNKYGNVRTIVDGISFHSKKEAARYVELRDLAASGAIQNLRLQVRYVLNVGIHKICTYIADFVYEQDGNTIVEDVKGRITDVYRLKKKLMYAILGISIKET